MDTSVSPMRTAMNAGAIIAALMLVTFFMGWQTIGLIVFILGINYGMKHYRKELGGCISYGRALLAGFQTALFTSVILAFVAYVSVTLDSSALEATLEVVDQRMKTSGISSELVETAMSQLREMLTPVAFAATYIFSYSTMGVLFSIVLAFFVKRDIIFVKY